jgi:hypothetical protein
MADDAAFVSTGRIEVDLGALKASLTKAESEVQQSTVRQAKSYEDFANRVRAANAEAAKRSQETRIAGFSTGAYDRKFGPNAPGAAGGGAGITAIGRAAKDASEGLKPLAEHGNAAGHAVRNLLGATLGFIPGAGYFRQHLNQMTGGMLGAGGGASKMALAITGATAAIVISTHVIVTWLEHAAEAAKTQYELARAVDTLDLGRADSQYKEATEALAAHTQAQRDFMRTGSVGGDVVHASTIIWDAWTGAVARNTLKQRAASTAWVEIARAVDLVKQEAASATATADLTEKMARRQISAAASAKDLAVAYGGVAMALRQRAEAELESLAADERAEKLDKTAEQQAVVSEKYELRRGDVLKKAASAAVAFADEQVRAALEISKADAEQTAALSGNATKRAKSYAEEQGIVDNVYVRRKEALKDAIRQNVDVMANQRALMKLEDDYKQQTAEISARKVAADAKVAELAIEQGARRVRAVETTTAAVRKIEAEAAQARAEAGNRGVDVNSRLDEQLSQRRQLADETKRDRDAEDELFSVRQGSLQAQIALGVNARENMEELARLQAEHSTRTVEMDQDAARKQAELGSQQIAQRKGDYDRLLSFQQQNVQQLLQLSGAPLRVQLDSAVKILGQSEEGTKRWWEQLSRVHDVTKQIHDAAKGAFATLTSMAEDRLRARGKTKVTRGDLQKEIDTIEKENERTRSTFEGGGAVKLGTIGQAVSNKDLFGQFNQNFNGDIGRAFTAATMTPEQATAMQTGWQMGFNQVGEVVDKFIDETKSKMDALGSDLGEMVGAKMNEAVSRALYLEGKRGGATQDTQ